MPGELDLTLAWPDNLFRWEANRILKLPKTGDWTGYVTLLLREAFEDADVANNFESLRGPSHSVDMTEHWLQELLAGGDLRQPLPAMYYAERHGQIDSEAAGGEAVSLGAELLSVVSELAERGYFPKLLPVECVDDYDSGTSAEEVTRAIRRAIKYTVDWPINDPDGLPEPVLYSLIEFFHDQAQRPRSSHWHSFNSCGWHYSDWSADSGRVVYRWRVNALLEDRDVPLRLGSVGDERGRLIQRFAPPLNDLADSELSERAADPEDEVAHGIMRFRERSASMVQKRSALSTLAGALEARRLDLKATLTADERDLFNIANNYAIRHRRADQKTDYGPEYADWIFWNFLSAISLVDALKRRVVKQRTHSNRVSLRVLCPLSAGRRSRSRFVI